MSNSVIETPASQNRQLRSELWTIFRCVARECEVSLFNDSVWIVGYAEDGKPSPFDADLENMQTLQTGGLVDEK